MGDRMFRLAMYEVNEDGALVQLIKPVCCSNAT